MRRRGKRGSKKRGKWQGREKDDDVEGEKGNMKNGDEKVDRTEKDTMT